jgi:succinoglycan biosynthesis transport protein ExoP
MPEEMIVMPRISREPSPTMRDFLAVFFRQRRLVLISFAVVLFGAVLHRLVAPTYRAEMKVLVRHGRVDPVVTAQPTQLQFEREAVAEEELNSEAELLHDQEILRTVVERSGLADMPSWYARVTEQSAEERTERAVRKLDNQLTVEPTRKSALIAVSYDSPDPQLAARVLRCLGDAYVERETRVLRPDGQSNFFEQQITQSRGSLQVAEEKLLAFTRTEGVVAASQQRDIALQKLGEAEADERSNQIALAEAAERTRMLRNKLNQLPERITTVIRNSDNPQSLGKMKSKLLELQIQRRQLLTRFEPTYRLVQEVDGQIKQTRETIAAEELTPLREQTSDVDPDHAWAREQLLHAEVEMSALQAKAKATGITLAGYREDARRFGEQTVAQDELMSDLKAAEQKYLLYLGKREEARIGDALDEERILNVVIAEQPTVPALPVRSSMVFGLLALLVAGGTSTVLAFAADRLHPGFRTPDDVVLYLGAPVLASLPRRES